MWIRVGPDVFSWTQEKEEGEPDKVSECCFSWPIASPMQDLKEDCFGDLQLLGGRAVSLSIAVLLAGESKV
jgi:hypothetical protein